MHYAATTLANWIIGIRKVLDAGGHDSAALFFKAGLDCKVDDPEARFPAEKTRLLWQLAVAATGDPCFGLKVAGQATHTTFHALGYAIAASATLKDAFDRILRYYRIVTDAGDLELQRTDHEYHLLLRVPDSGPQPAPESIDALISLFVRMCRSRAGRDFSPLRIDLRRSPPPDIAAFQRILRAPVRFGADENRLVLSRADVERRLEGAHPELARHNDEIAVRYLARLDRGNIIVRVHAALTEQLPLGDPAAGRIAQQLHMSERSLQRKLADAGTTYREVLDDTRHQLAIAYLQGRQRTISEVTFLLGFADTRSFSRAFRRWTGQSPSEYSARKT